MMAPKPWMAVDMATHYMKFAAGSYGWSMYVFSKPSATYGLIRVLFSSRWVYVPNNQVTLHSVQDCYYADFVATIYVLYFSVQLHLCIITGFSNKLFMF